LTRIVGLPLVAVAALFLLLPRPAWSHLAVLAAAFALPVAMYALWFGHVYGQVNLTASSGIFLYGRTVNFVDCGRVQFSSDQLRRLCPVEPVGQRNEIWYVFDVSSPIAKQGLGDVAANSLAGEFATQAIRAQPDGFLRLSWRGIVQSFGWDQRALYNDLVFTVPVALPPDAGAASVAYQAGGDPGPRYQPALVRDLAEYQGVASVPGTLCLLALLLAPAALVFGRDPDRRGLRPALVLTAGTSAGRLAVPPAPATPAG